MSSCSRYDLLKAKVEWIASLPFFGGATAVLMIMAGALASFFTEEIKTNLTPFWSSSSVSIKATTFWFCIFSAGFFLGLGEWAQNRKVTRTANSLENMVKRLNTLPADGYLPSYQSCYRVAAAITYSVTYHPNPTILQVEEAIRNVIGAILETARDFDQGGDSSYCGNIMLWRENGDSIEAASPIHIVNYVKGDPQVSGLLELIPELSTTTEGNERYDKDLSIKSIILQIPSDASPVHDKEMNLRYPLLPGAPLAFINKVFVSYESISKLHEWIDTKCGLEARAISKIKSYFSHGDGKSIRSFCSIPILLPTKDANTGTANPIGILNLHSAEEGILQDNGQTLFAPLLEPFLMLLSLLLLKRKDISIAAVNVTK